MTTWLNTAFRKNGFLTTIVSIIFLNPCERPWIRMIQIQKLFTTRSFSFWKWLRKAVWLFVKPRTPIMRNCTCLNWTNSRLTYRAWRGNSLQAVVIWPVLDCRVRKNSTLRLRITVIRMRMPTSRHCGQRLHQLLRFPNRNKLSSIWLETKHWPPRSHPTRHMHWY